MEVDFALGHHFGGGFGGDSVFIGEHLQDGEAPVLQLGNYVASEFSGGRDLVEDAAHFAHGGACDGGGVAGQLEDSLKFLAGFDAGCCGAGGDGCCVSHAEGCAFYGGHGVVHDRGDAFG